MTRSANQPADGWEVVASEISADGRTIRETHANGWHTVSSIDSATGQEALTRRRTRPHREPSAASSAYALLSDSRLNGSLAGLLLRYRALDLIRMTGA